MRLELDRNRPVAASNTRSRVGHVVPHSSLHRANPPSSVVPRHGAHKTKSPDRVIASLLATAPVDREPADILLDHLKNQVARGLDLSQTARRAVEESRDLPALFSTQVLNVVGKNEKSGLSNNQGAVDKYADAVLGGAMTAALNGIGASPVSLIAVVVDFFEKLITHPNATVATTAVLKLYLLNKATGRPDTEFEMGRIKDVLARLKGDTAVPAEDRRLAEALAKGLPVGAGSDHTTHMKAFAA